MAVMLSNVERRYTLCTTKPLARNMSQFLGKLTVNQTAALVEFEKALHKAWDSKLTGRLEKYAASVPGSTLNDIFRVIFIEGRALRPFTKEEQRARLIKDYKKELRDAKRLKAEGRCTFSADAAGPSLAAGRKQVPIEEYIALCRAALKALPTCDDLSPYDF